MSSNQLIIDAATRHQVFLQRYGAGQSKQAQIGLDRLRRNINARLAQEPTIFQRNRLLAVLEDIERLAFEAFGTIATESIYGAQQLASIEAGFSVNLFNKGTSLNASFVLPAEATLIAAVMESAMSVNVGSTITLEAAFANFSKNKTKQIMRAISDGVTLGETTPAISRTVGGLINTLQRRQLDTLVRTVTNNVSSIARQQVYIENAELLNGYRWVATLDGRTTMICGSRDGMVFENPGIDPMPPAHWGACVEDTLITTKRGSIHIQDVKVGDYALTHTGRWKRVNAIMAKPATCKVVELMDSLGSSVRLTMDHPILTSIGYKAAGDIHTIDKLFNYGNKLTWPKYRNYSSFVKESVLINAHNMKTEIVERLVAYSVTSLSAGMSASIKLNKDVTNSKIRDIVADNLLRFKLYIIRFKKLGKQFFMKSKIIFKGGR